jgi:putative transcriptional regulator
MSIRHHPSAETMAAYAAGSLDLARHLVVAAHLERCAACRKLAGDFEEVGASMLEALPLADMADDALTRALARIDGIAPDRRMSLRAPEAALPQCLGRYRLGDWRRLGRGLEIRPILLPQPHTAKLFLLKGQAGIKLPQHSHAGDEFTSVLSGAFTDERSYFGPGDFDQTDEGVEHRPVVTPDGECICLVALEGRLKLSGILGTLLSPFVRL